MSVVLNWAEVKCLRDSDCHSLIWRPFLCQQFLFNLVGLMVFLLSARTLGVEVQMPRIRAHLQMHWSPKSSFLSILLWIRQIATCVQFKCILFSTSQLQVWVVFLCWWPWFYLALPFWQQKCVLKFSRWVGCVFKKICDNTCVSTLA